MSYHCVPCNRRFNTTAALQQHRQDAPAHDFNCTACDRHFSSEEALSQHQQDSPAHASTFDCDRCNRSFGSEDALQSHVRDSPAHTSTLTCEDCERSFGSEDALQQHFRDSPAHAPTLDCDSCNRSFGSEGALQDHLRDSPAHNSSFTCEKCDRSFGSVDATQQHFRDSPAHSTSIGISTRHVRNPLMHALSFDEGSSNQSYGSGSENTFNHQPQHTQAQALFFDCTDCNRLFSSEQALEQHQRDSPVHQQILESPLDLFFSSFPNFVYDPALPPATSYGNLKRQNGWQRGDNASDDAWDRYQHALESELRMWFGAEDDLASWHSLCRAIGIESPPQTFEQCERVVRGTHVNIVDLIEWGRGRGRTGKRVHVFHDLEELRRYTKETRKIFRGTLDEKDDKNDNVVLRHLLRKIFAL